MRKTSCIGNWKVRGPGTAETGCTVMGRLHPGAGCTAPKIQHTKVGVSLTKESIPNKGGRFSGAWATDTGCTLYRTLPAMTRGGMHRTQGQRSNDGRLSVQIGPLERRVVMGANGPESRDGMHRTLSLRPLVLSKQQILFDQKKCKGKRYWVVVAQTVEMGCTVLYLWLLGRRKQKRRKGNTRGVTGMRKGMLKELDDKLERIGKLEVEESGKVMKQCKLTDIYKEDLGPDVRPRKPMILGGEDSSGWEVYHQFQANSLVQKAQMEIRKTVEEELRVQVDTGKDYCVVAVSLGLQSTGRKVGEGNCLRIYGQQSNGGCKLERGKWNEGKRKEKVKNRPGNSPVQLRSTWSW